MNQTIASSSISDPSINFIVGSLNIIIIFIGVPGNTISFLLFRFHRSFKTIPSMVYLSFLAITDTLILFGWNLAHFYLLVYNIDIVDQMGCQFFNFAQYTSVQASGLLMSVTCVDRYVTIIAMPGSFLQRLPFGTIKRAFAWSIGILIFCALLNLHLLFTLGYHEPSATNGSNSNYPECFRFSNGMPLSVWDQVNLVFYNIIPFFIMISFNTLLIVDLRRKLQPNKQNKKPILHTASGQASRKKISLTISLITLSFLFLIMTTPGSILFAFFNNYDFVSDLNTATLFLIDDVSYLNHSFLFLVSFISIKKFRQTVIRLIKRRTHETSSHVS